MTTTQPKAALWRHPGFAKFWAAQTVSAFGDQISLAFNCSVRRAEARNRPSGGATAGGS